MIDKNIIKDKLDKLELVKKQLKVKFIGIDEIIDNFIDSVKVWYVAPELQLRPLIINLWGMTGVGKTDLIRTFVNLINFNDKFIELQMDNLSYNINYGPKSVQHNLEMILDDSNDNGILLLDEMQRFKTVDEFGKDLNRSETDKYSDIWSLLSDGKFSNKLTVKDDLNDLFYEILTTIEYEKEANNKPKKSKFKLYYWRAKRLKKLLFLDDKVEDIMQWDLEIILDKIQKQIESSDTYNGSSYSKLLIIISGNLDEAYRMSEDTNETDIDADIYHEFSKNITLIDIKKALTKRFKPEQIARFGNNHLIYPSLNRDSYEKIIKAKCNEIAAHIKNKTNIHIKFNDTILNVIYRNGVFPTQGVRPVLSTISTLIENNMPFFVYNCLNKNINNIIIDFKDEYLISTIADETFQCKINTVIDNIKKDKNSNKESVVAVHEVGHAIVYMDLFNLVPLQLVCNTASSASDGFLMPHSCELSKKILKNNIIVSLAGQSAEEIIFGDDIKTNGASADIANATQFASLYVRVYGMDGYVGNVITAPNPQNPSYGILESDITNESIHTLLKECKYEATNILNKNLPLLKKLTTVLLNKKKLNNNDIYNVSVNTYPNILNEKTSYVVVENYTEIMNKKFEQII